MTQDYGFGELENQLIQAGKDYPPNFAKMRELLAAGADINAVSNSAGSERNLLSSIILEYDFADDMFYEDESESIATRRDGRYLPDICRFFLEQGFHVCGSHVVWYGCDAYILEAIKILLRAGVYLGKGDSCKDLLSGIATEASYQRCVCEDHDRENLFETMYSIIAAAVEGHNFEAIEYFTGAVGRKLEGIDMYCDPGQEAVFSMHEPEFQSDRCFTGTIVFWCEGKALRVNQGVDIMVDPAVSLDPDKVRIDMGPHFSRYIGSVLEKIDFDHENTVKGTTHYGRAIINLHFSNESMIRISSNFGKVPNEKYAAFFEV